MLVIINSHIFLTLLILLRPQKINLMQNVFCFDNKKTKSWKFIETFYNNDKKQQYRCAPKLTDAYIYPNNFQKMKVKLATQVISRTVAIGLQTHNMTLGVLPAEAQATLEVVEKFDKLFDLLNAVDFNHPNPYKTVRQK